MNAVDYNRDAPASGVELRTFMLNALQRHHVRLLRVETAETRYLIERLESSESQLAKLWAAVEKAGLIGDRFPETEAKPELMERIQQIALAHTSPPQAVRDPSDGSVREPNW